MQKLAGYCSILILLFAAGAYGQGGGNAAMAGTVTDPSGAVIAKANVVMTQMGTEVKRTATSNGSGQFTIPSIPPAVYRLTVEAAGFKTYVQDVTLLADQSGSLQIAMQLGQAQETVTVEATATLVNTATPVLSQVIERSRVVELPLNGRNAADLTKMVAGTVDSNNGAGTSQGNTKQVPGAEVISVNGARPDQISYNLELCDRMGILVLAGWCCCDHWEKWAQWDKEDEVVAAESLRDQLRRLARHPSVFDWLYGSDNPPPPKIEQIYLDVIKDVEWPNPYQSSATAKKTPAGDTGVKMTGPYEYVPPSYWLLDTKAGGAHGFNTETSPGPAPPPIESLR